MDACAVAMELVVRPDEVAIQEPLTLPKSLLNISTTVSQNDFISVATQAISADAVSALSDATTGQGDSDMWFEQRAGRITASILSEVVKKVSDTGVISHRNNSLLKKIMNYESRSFYSPAIHWGKYNEQFAKDKFFKLNRRKHRNLQLKQCGLILFDKNPIFAGTPDSLLICQCCGTYPLEVKNPYKYRNLSINKLAEQPDSCLHFDQLGQVKLKEHHPYYYQVQAQILAAHSQMGYFAIKTASQYNNFHHEKISFNPSFTEGAIRKSTIFFEKVVIPEIYHGTIKKICQDTEINVVQSPSVITTRPEPTCCESTAPQASVTSSSMQFQCSLCCKECIDEPLVFNDMSINCDKCGDWFHWLCVNISGNEVFLKKKRMVWHCPECSVKTC